MTENPQTQDDASIRPADDGKPKKERKDPVIVAGFIVIAVIVSVLVFPAISSMISSISHGGNCSCTKAVVATAQQPDNGTIVVKYQGGQDAPLMNGMTATITDCSGQIQSIMAGNQSGLQCDWIGWADRNLHLHPQPTDHCITPPPLTVGEEISFTGNFSGKDHVVARAHFSDGSNLFILDTTL